MKNFTSKKQFIEKKRAHLIPLKKTMSASAFEEYSIEWCRKNRPTKNS